LEAEGNFYDFELAIAEVEAQGIAVHRGELGAMMAFHSHPGPNPHRFSVMRRDVGTVSAILRDHGLA